jgi:regulatory protein
MRIDSVQKGASGTATIAVGGVPFLVNIAQVEELGLPAASLAVGMELDDAGQGILALAAEAREAEKRGLSLLARAEQSVFMLRMKLEAREFSRRAVGIAVDRLIAEGFLDDRRFADAYAASRLAHRSSKAEGPASLVAALRNRGVDRTVAAESVAALLGPGEREAALATASTKELKRSGGDKDAARRRLRELGFRSEEITEQFESIR